LINENLDTAGLPDPDMIVRTSGEERTSGFLTWQSAYSELYFTKKNWPDFDEKELDKVIDEYNKRQRRFGK
jgi:undecaprenyl diphosphate synthase